MTRNAVSFVRFRHLTLAGSAALALTLASSAAHAQNNNANCPPGSWFCAEAAPQAAAPAGGTLQPLPSDSPPPVIVTSPPPPPPVVVYQPPPPTIIVRESPPPYVYRAPDYYRKNEWGMNLHLGGAAIGKGASGDAGMGIIGAGLRYRPIPHLAIQGDLDFAGGRDYNGFRRTETELAVNAMVFINPRDRAQFYLLTGLGMSAAHAVDDRNGFDGRSYDYTYFGWQFGAGLEYRAARHVALNLDGRLFVRGRIDSDATAHPEFTDSNGQTTNASGGGLVTGGITFYF